MEAPVIEYAEKYFNSGFNILPLNFREKTPALSSWREWQAHRQEHDVIRKFFENQERNIAIICGGVSNLVVLDFDTHDGGTGEETFHRFFRKWEELCKETWVVRTPRGGIHAYFKVIGGFKSRKVPALYMEIRGDGNYVVAPPSIHPNGGEYKFISTTEKLMEIEKENFAQMLAQRLNELGVVSEKGVAVEDFGFNLKKQQIAPAVKILIASGAKEGMRNDARYRIFMHAKRRGWENEEILGLLLEFNRNCKPPDSEEKVKAHFRQMLGQDNDTLPFFEGIPTQTLKRFVVMRGDEKNFYVFEFLNGAKIKLTDEQLMSPKPFIVAYLRTHGEIISVKASEWRNFVNFLLKSQFAVVLEKEILSDEEEFRDAVLDVLHTTPAVEKIENWRPAFSFVEGDKVYLANQQIKNIAQRYFSSGAPSQKLRAVLADYLASTTEQKMINKRRVRFWVFAKDKVFTDGREMIMHKEEENES